MKKFTMPVLPALFASMVAQAAPVICPPAAQLSQQTAQQNLQQASARSLAFLQDNSACADVVHACNSAGYFLGCHTVNNMGLAVDCMGTLFRSGTLGNVNQYLTNAADVQSCHTFCKSNKGTALSCDEQKGVANR